VVLCEQVGWLVGGDWLAQVRVRWETDGFVWKVSGSCHQHALHQVDTYFEDEVA
jgi:hypothetical protein